MSDVKGLRQVALPATDVDRAVAFFRDTVGLPFIARFGDLAVDDMQAARAALQARGVEFQDEPNVIFHDSDGTFGDAGVDEWMTFFRDSEGNLLALSSRE